MTRITQSEFTATFGLDCNGYEHSSITQNALWRTQIIGLISITDNSDIKKSLEMLSETIQFSAIDMSNNASIGNKLNSAVKELSSKCYQPNANIIDINKQISKIMTLLEQREHELKITKFQNGRS